MQGKMLTTTDISDRVGYRSFERGLEYARAGHIINPRIQGELLKSECIGSASIPYRVEVKLGAAGIEEGACSCPVGDGGYCKHVAALLLTWLDQPDQFLEAVDTRKALAALSKQELITIIERMTVRYPDLEALLEIELGRPGAGEPVTADWVRRQAQRAFREGGDDWRASYRIANGLHHVLQPGAGYVERAEWANAFVLYATVARMVMEEYGAVHDEESELVGVLVDCGGGLAECLAAADARLRKDILRALFDIYRWDTDAGGDGAAEGIPSSILDVATSDEKRMVAQWVREVLPAGAGMIEDWHRKNYGAFLLGLEEEWLDDETYLRVCNETGRWFDLTERLLALGRIDEAIAAAREQNDYTFLGLADIFVAHGQDALARKLVGERAVVSSDARLVGWLRAEAVSRNDLAAALILTERLFWGHPGLTGYLEIQELARVLAFWNDFQAPLLARLEEQRMYSLLTEIHLHDGEVEEALETYQQVLQTNEWGFGWGVDGLRVKVAEAAAQDFPREAIRLFEEQAEKLIDGHSRGSYAGAAQYLLRVRELHRRLDDEVGWTDYITRLRGRHGQLRALADELRLAGV